MTLLAGHSSTLALATAQQISLPDNRFLGKIRNSIPNISTQELKSKPVLLDVRTMRKASLTEGKIRAKSSIIIPRGWLEFRIGDAVTDKNASIIAHEDVAAEIEEGREHIRANAKRNLKAISVASNL